VYLNQIQMAVPTSDADLREKMGREFVTLPLNHFSSANPSTDAIEFPAFTPFLFECAHFVDALPAAKSIPSGMTLVEQGRCARNVQLVESGMVKLVHVNACGREISIGLRSEGWYAGYTSVLTKTASAYSVHTVTPCKIATIPAEEFTRCLTRNPEILDHFISVLCFEVASQANLQIEVMSSSAEDRLDRFMRERKARRPSRNTVDPLYALKQMELAQLLAITPEHLSRLMSKKRNEAHRQATSTAMLAQRKVG
jgi:CRP-like cAMP-binding protein